MKNPGEVKNILQSLREMYPEPKTALHYTTPFELLVATILSAQCTDVQVNKTTAALFEKFSTPEEFAALEPEGLAEHIKGCGLYRNKAKNIVEAGRILVRDYGSRVPETMEELIKLPGVGRKTANVVMANAFRRPALAVDTHVYRVANRLGLAQAKDVVDTEKQLMQAIPEELWRDAHHWLIFHGRSTCRARRPKCTACRLAGFCDYHRGFWS
jgi:endonuclease-3